MTTALPTSAQALGALLAGCDDIRTGCQLAQDALLARFGGRLFTLTASFPERGVARRLWSNLGSEYSEGGEKPILADAWSDQVLKRGEPFRGSTIEDVKPYFPDHAQISGLGLGAVLNLPVRAGGRTIGTVNLLDADHAYDGVDLSDAFAWAQALKPIFTAYHAAATGSSAA